MTTNQDSNTDFRGRLAALRRNWLQLLYGLSLIVGLTLVFSLQLINNPGVALSPGDVVEEDVRAVKTDEVYSAILTEQKREEATNRVPEVYRSWDPDIGRQQGDAADQLFAFIEVVRADRFANRETKLDYLGAVADTTIDRTLGDDILSLSNTSFEIVRRETTGVIDEIMQEDIPDDGTMDADERVSRAVSLRLSELQERVVLQLAPQFIVPNKLLDDSLTQQLKDQARQEVADVTRSVTKNEVIIAVGEQVTPEDIELLDALGMLKTQPGWWDFGRIALLVSVAVVAIMLYWHNYIRPEYFTRRYLVVFYLLMISVALGIAGTLNLPGNYQLLFPVASLAMILAVIISPRLAIVAGVVVAGMIGFIANQSLETAIYFAAGSVLAVYWLRGASRLNALFNAGLITALTNVVVILVFNATSQTTAAEFATLIGLAVGNGLLSVALTIVGFFLIGNFSGIITTLQLQDLSHFDHPLLTELLRRAPGTYHHSIMVANLAEQAAERIHADGNLVRVGALYHDIGKMLRPAFFTENQGSDNPHDRLDPRSSARTIISHVTEGLELADRYRLPRRVRDFIAEHHGDRMMTHFYKKATERSEEPVDPAPFCYPGPAPRSRETAVVMMADAIEATSSAVRPNNPAACEKLVDSIIDDMMREGQLDNSGLTLNDIKICRQSFSETLQGRFHVRVKYAGNESLEAANTPPVTLPTSSRPAPPSESGPSNGAQPGRAVDLPLGTSSPSNS